MIKSRGSLNIDRLKVCFRSNDYIIDRLQEQFQKSGSTLDYVDFRLIKIDDKDSDNLTVAVDMDMEDNVHRFGHFKFPLNGMYRGLVFFTYENRALYTPFMEYMGEKSSIAGMVEDIAAVIGLEHNNITVAELAFDTNINILNSVRKAVRNVAQLNMFVNGKRVVYNTRKIEDYCEMHSSSRERLIYPPTLYIRQKKEDGLRLKIYNKSKEMNEASPSKKEYIPAWDNIPENQTIYRVEVTVRNEDIADYCRMQCIPREEALYRLTSDSKFRYGLWEWCCNRLLYFKDKDTGEKVDILDTYNYR